MSAKILPAALALLAGCAVAPASAPIPPTLVDTAPAPREWAEACSEFDEWDKPGPPFRVYGNTYYVGTCGITSLLVTSAKGHVLIDSGTDKGAEIVLANIRTLGFDSKDVAHLLMSHEHFDHIGGMARLQAATGAPILTTREAAAVLRSGLPGADDPQAASSHPPFSPVKGEIRILEGERLQRIGGRTFQPIRTPGHTPGALSWTWEECEQDRCEAIVYVDSLNPISADGYRFSGQPEYLAAFRAGIAEVAGLRCGILLAPHPSAAGLRERLLGNKALRDSDGCREYAAAVTRRLDERLAKEDAVGR